MVDHERHVESPITTMERIGVSTCGLHSSRVDDTGEARIDGIQFTNMEATEGVAEHLWCGVWTRGICGYSATILQTCRKRSDGLLGGQSRAAKGTISFSMGSSRRSGAVAMY